MPAVPKMTAKVMPVASSAMPVPLYFFALLRTFSTGVGSGKPNIWRAHWGMPVLPAAAVPSAAFRRASCWFL